MRAVKLKVEMGRAGFAVRRVEGKLKMVHSGHSDSRAVQLSSARTQRVLSTHMGYTYPNHKGNYYYRNPTLYHIGTLDPLGKDQAKALELLQRLPRPSRSRNMPAHSYSPP